MNAGNGDLILGANRLVIDIIRALLGGDSAGSEPPVAVLVDPTSDDWEQAGHFEGRTVAVLSEPEPETILGALHAGADAIVPAESVADRLVEAVALVREGHAFLTPAQTRILIEAVRRSGPVDDRPKLSKRESEILHSIVEGRSVKQTAVHLGITPKTVENLQGRMFRKLEVRNRAHAVARAYELGLLDDAEHPPGADTPLPAGGDRP